MSEIFHPPVELDIMPDNTLEQIFVQEACLMLNDCGVANEEKSGGQNITTISTERIDMVNASDDTTVALRLQSLPVVTSPLPGIEKQDPSEEYTVVALQYSIFDEEFGEIDDDEELKWESYVLAVVNNHDPHDLQVLDAKTGLSLDNGDLMTAQVLLSRLREEMRSERFEEDGISGNLVATFRPIPRGPDYVPFESAEFIDTEVCYDSCSYQHQSCNHSPYSDN